MLQNRWWIPVASLSGLMVGTATVNMFGFGVFLKPVSADLGLSRGLLSSGILLANLMSGLALPIFGVLIDRWGIRRVMLPGIVLFALSIAAFSRMENLPPAAIYVLFGLVGLFGAAQSNVPYAAMISRCFDRDRGLALGVAMAGVGLGVSIIPELTGFLIRDYGWRNAYVGLSLTIILLAFVPVALVFREPTASAKQSRGAHGREGPGMTAAEAFGQWRFWALALGFFAGAAATSGTLAHAVPMLMDRGVSLQSATAALSGAGLAMIVARVVCGYCLDRFPGPQIAICFFLVPAIGINLLLSGFSGIVPLVGVLLCGLGTGAQVGLQAFFASRYFGLKSYGTVFAAMFALYLAGGGFGATIAGVSFDVWHSYSPAYLLFGVGLPIVALVFLLAPLGPYRYAAHAA